MLKVPEAEGPCAWLDIVSLARREGVYAVFREAIDGYRFKRTD